MGIKESLRVISWMGRKQTVTELHPTQGWSRKERALQSCLMARQSNAEHAFEERAYVEADAGR